jgi:hypothetical protein
MKIIFLSILGILIIGCPLRLSERFDFKKNTPLDFLNYLANCDEMYYFVNYDSIPINWLNLSFLPELMEKIDSKKITTPVFSTRYSTDLSYKTRTTEGVEALFMIESLHKGKKYPSELSSNTCGILVDTVFIPDTVLIKEIEIWFNNLPR